MWDNAAMRWMLLQFPNGLKKSALRTYLGPKLSKLKIALMRKRSLMVSSARSHEHPMSNRFCIHDHVRNVSAHGILYPTHTFWRTLRPVIHQLQLFNQFNSIAMSPSSLPIVIETMSSSLLPPTASCDQTGLDPTTYDSLFTDGVHTKCAANGYCGMRDACVSVGV